MSIYLASLGEGYRHAHTSDQHSSHTGNHNSSNVFIVDSGQFFGHHDNIFTTAATYSDTSSLVVTSSVTTPPPANMPADGVTLFRFIVWGILGNTLAILGFLGNTLSIVVLHRRQMRSSTSYYLLSLAIYDNGILLGMMLYFCLPALAPYTSFLKDYRFFLSMTLPFGYPISLSAQMGSIYTCVGFTVERFIAVCKPLHAANTCTKSRTMRAITLILVWSAVYNIPRFFHYEVYYKDAEYGHSPTSSPGIGNYSESICLEDSYLANRTYVCPSNITSNMTVTDVIFNLSDLITTHLTPESPPSSNNSILSPTEPKRSPVRSEVSHRMTDFGLNPTFKHLYLIYFQLFFMFLLPFLIILIMNIGLIRAVRTSKSMRQSMCASARKEHSLTVMLIAVIVVFLVSQFPTIIDNILVAVMEDGKLSSNTSYMYFWISCTFLVEVNAASNFLLYCFFGKKFRQMLLDILGIKKKQHQLAYRSTVCKSRTNGTRTYEMEVSVM